MIEGEMLFRTLPTTPHQNICKATFDSKVILKSIIDPDDNILKSIIGLNLQLSHSHVWNGPPRGQPEVIWMAAVCKWEFGTVQPIPGTKDPW